MSFASSPAWQPFLTSQTEYLPHQFDAVHFFDISTSKSAPKPTCFDPFYFQMCLAKQLALFPHLNFEKSSEHGVLWHFWLPNVLRTTMACTFPTSQRPKVLRTWNVLTLFTSKCARTTRACIFLIPQLVKMLRSRGVLTLLASKCASSHNGVQFFISHLAS